jgi:hypothetical protein
MDLSFARQSAGARAQMALAAKQEGASTEVTSTKTVVEGVVGSSQTVNTVTSHSETVESTAVDSHIVDSTIATIDGVESFLVLVCRAP